MTLGRILERLGELGGDEPNYTPPRCLRERQSMGGCDLCARVCPHNAITLGPLGNSVSIDPSLCTGCGLCVQVCPSGALEYDLTRPLELVRSAARLAAEKGPNVAAEAGAEATAEAGAALTCAQTEAARSGVPALTCLARVTPAALSAAGAWEVPLTLLHGNCAGCPIGSAAVPAYLAAAVEETQRLRRGTAPARITVREATPDDTIHSAKVSRRGALRGLLGMGRREAAHLLPHLPTELFPAELWNDPAETALEAALSAAQIPEEWRWRKASLKPAPTEVYWPAPLVDDRCMDCPVCSNVCPTQAIQRSHDGGHFTLVLELAACTGCMACVESCPPKAMHRNNIWRFEAFNAPLLLLSRP